MSNKFTVLIVDDDAHALHLLTEILQDSYQLAFATNGEMAISAAEKLNPDIILLDIMMPDLDGYEVCKRLKADAKTQDIPIIFVTALNEISDEAKGLDIGAIDYLIKPFRPPIVKARIKNHVFTKKKIERLANLAAIDGLTELANRREFEERYTGTWNQAVQEQYALTVMLIDIDHFKLYNDNYGHPAGDECLISVAKTLRNTLQRSTDFVARYGGEEFVVLLRRTNASRALVIANKICDAVRELKIPHDHSLVTNQLTISLGLITFIPDKNITKSDFIENVDQALYRAKIQGRNQIYQGEIES